MADFEAASATTAPVNFAGMVAAVLCSAGMESQSSEQVARTSGVPAGTFCCYEDDTTMVVSAGQTQSRWPSYATSARLRTSRPSD